MSSTRLIPEKTIELWNAFAVVDSFGPDTWIWSPTRDVDQVAGSPAAGQRLKKVLLMELKAPISTKGPPRNRKFEINSTQLIRYVKRYVGQQGSRSPDVLYMLPYTPWTELARTLIPKQMNPTNRREYPYWTFVVRASELYRYLRACAILAGARTLDKDPAIRLYRNASMTRPCVSSVLWTHSLGGVSQFACPYWPYCHNCLQAFHWNRGMIRSERGGKKPTPPIDFCGVPTLFEVFRIVQQCEEPRGVALRSDRHCQESDRLWYPDKGRLRDNLESNLGQIEPADIVLNDGLPSEDDWPEDEDLELTDETLRDIFESLFPRAGSDGENVDDEDRGEPTNEPTQSNLQIACIVA